MTEERPRNVGSAVLGVIREQGRLNGRTVEEIKAGLLESADGRKNRLLDRLTHERADQFARYGALPDSAPGIRAEREAR